MPSGSTRLTLPSSRVYSIAVHDPDNVNDVLLMGQIKTLNSVVQMKMSTKAKASAPITAVHGIVMTHAATIC